MSKKRPIQGVENKEIAIGVVPGRRHEGAVAQLPGVGHANVRRGFFFRVGRLGEGGQRQRKAMRGRCEGLAVARMKATQGRRAVARSQNMRKARQMAFKVAGRDSACGGALRLQALNDVFVAQQRRVEQQRRAERRRKLVVGAQTQFVSQKEVDGALRAKAQGRGPGRQALRLRAHQPRQLLCREPFDDRGERVRRVVLDRGEPHAMVEARSAARVAFVLGVSGVKARVQKGAHHRDVILRRGQGRDRISAGGIAAQKKRGIDAERDVGHGRGESAGLDETQLYHEKERTGCGFDRFYQGEAPANGPGSQAWRAGSTDREACLVAIRGGFGQGCTLRA